MEKGAEDLFSKPLYKTKHHHSLMYFFENNSARDKFIHKMNAKKGIYSHSLNFMPVAILTLNPGIAFSQNLISDPEILYVALNKPAGEKESINEFIYSTATKHPGLATWWNKGYRGQNTILGLIDSGIAPDHQALSPKEVLINTTKGSHYRDYPYGVRTAHGTGVACIYGGYHKNEKARRGIAFKAPVIMSTLAGEGNNKASDFWITYSSLNWLLSAESKPTLINYSFGNGEITCADCSDWSGMARVVDYIVNQYHILWVTSAGNNGFIKPKNSFPYNSTMTVPADNYNALTVANMNIYNNGQEASFTRKRETHKIYPTSSRGPTLRGRKKPDISAPGNNTLTCAPDPQKYKITYTPKMRYKDGYRLMGGTSSAAPHVGAAALLLHSAQITHPMMIKALLINSADSWTTDDGHHAASGSEWNPTYGWGYMNLKNAYQQKDFLDQNQLSIKQPAIEYHVMLNDYDKITLIHERRVGFIRKGRPWKLAQLTLEIFDFHRGIKLASDSSAIDTVHQVSLHTSKIKEFADPAQQKEVVVRVSLNTNTLEGSPVEPYAIAFPGPILSITK